MTINAPKEIQINLPTIVPIPIPIPITAPIIDLTIDPIKTKETEANPKKEEIEVNLQKEETEGELEETQETTETGSL